MSTPLPAIQIDGLIKDFPIGIRGVKLRAVDQVSFDIKPNEIYGLLGPNGSGKSTTIKVILGLLRPTRGSCFIFGNPVGSVEARRKVGYLPEAPYFYRFLTGRELVRFYGKACGVRGKKLEESTETVLDLVGMSEAARRRVGTYSKGMLQRIGLAQALVHDPDLIILDEPTAGVDPIGSAEITDIIRELKKRGKTVLLCSHLLSQVEDVCDRVAIMNKGKLLVSGSVEELLTATDRSTITLDGLDAQKQQALKTWCAENNVSIHEIGTPRMRLDDLFLDKVRHDKEESK